MYQCFSDYFLKVNVARKTFVRQARRTQPNTRTKTKNMECDTEHDRNGLRCKGRPKTIHKRTHDILPHAFVLCKGFRALGTD